MKKTFFTTIIALLLVMLCTTAILPAASAQSAGVINAATLQMAAQNASAINGTIGATIPTEGDNVPGATIDGTYRPENAGNMDVLYANDGVKYDATNAPEGAIIIDSIEKWNEEISNAFEIKRQWGQLTDEWGSPMYDDMWEPIYGWVETKVPVPDENVYILTTDLVITESKGTATNPFKGTIYGNGHTITTDLPVFNYVEGASFYDMKIVSENGITTPTLIKVQEVGTTYYAIGSLVCVGSGASYYNVLNTANISTSLRATLVGGIQGSAVQKAKESDGIVAPGDVTFVRCKNIGNLSGATYIGGLAGVIHTDDGDVLIKDCVNEGNLTTTGDTAGGAAAGIRNASTKGSITIEGFLNKGVLTAHNAVGGVVGAVGNGIVAGDRTTYPRTTTILLKNVANVGDLSCSNTNGGIAVAGMVASISINAVVTGMYGSDAWNNNYVTFENCYNGGTVTGKWAAGMFSRGSATSVTFKHCTNAGVIREKAAGSNLYGATGGFISNYQTTPVPATFQAEYCLNTGVVSGYRAGGFFGIVGATFESATLNTCVNTADNKSSNYVAAGFFACPTFTGTLELVNCQNDGNITARWAGGLFGRPQLNTNITFQNCTNNGNCTSDGNGIAQGAAGGFIVYVEASTSGPIANEYTWINCENNGTISGDRPAGFIACGTPDATNNIQEHGAGKVNVYTVINSRNAGTINCTGYYGGAFAAYLHGEVQVMGFENTASVTSTSGSASWGYASGFIAYGLYTQGVISGVVNKGKITAPMTINTASEVDRMNGTAGKHGCCAAGVLAYLHGDTADLTIVNCYNLEQVKGQTAGGIVGGATHFDKLYITNCANTAVVASETAATKMQGAGGIAGSIDCQWGDATIVACVNTGDISAAANAAGGILGYSTANNNVDFETNKVYSGAWNIEGNINTGNVTATNGLAGGVAGYINTAVLPANISGNVVKGVVRANVRAGAILGVMGADSCQTVVLANLFVGELCTDDDQAKVFAGDLPEVNAAANFTATELAGATFVSVAQISGEMDGEGALVATLNGVAGKQAFAECKGCTEKDDFPAYAEVIDLYHAFDGECTGEKTSVGYNDTHHYNMCRCTEPDAATMVEHEFETEWKYYTEDGVEHHYKGCSDCGIKLQDAACEYEFVSDGASGHFEKCVACDKVKDGSATAHDTNAFEKNANGHWVCCSVCGYAQSTTPVPHNQNAYGFNELGHWAKCSVCDYAGEDAPALTKHDYGTESGVCDKCGFVCSHDPSHAGSLPATCVRGAICGVCQAVYGKPIPHDFSDEWVCDGNGQHYHVCQNGCGEMGGLTDCVYTDQAFNETSHWLVCAECGSKKADSEVDHIKGIGYDDTHHWNTCACGWVDAIKVEHTGSGEWLQNSEAPTPYHYRICSDCGAQAQKENCDMGMNGSAPTCTAPATCETCKKAYGTALSHLAAPDYQNITEDGIHYHYNMCARPGCGVQLNKTPCTVSEATCAADGVCEVCHAIYEGKNSNHIFSDWRILQEATCTSVGERERTCILCGKVERDTILSTEHLYEFVPGQEPTCVQEGWTHYQKCVDCGAEFGKEILPPQADKHQYVWESGYFATCVAQGRTDFEKCAQCGATRGGIAIPQLDHQFVLIDAKAPTCHELGHTEHYVCIYCKSTVGKQVIPQTHEYETVDAKAPTCTEEGHTAYEICVLCGNERGKCTLPAFAHSWMQIAGKAPTCTEDGYTAHLQCERCLLLMDKEILPAEHIFDVQDGKAPTCAEQGWSEYKLCLICNAVEGKVTLEVLPHSFIDVPAKDKTCTEPGYTAHRICTMCQVTDGKVIVPASHEYKIVAGKEATCTEDGYTAYRRCGGCGDEQNKVVIPAGHNYVIIPAQQPTCTTDGWEDYIGCTKCGDEQGKSVLPAVGHTWSAETGKCDACGEVCSHEYGADDICDICGYKQAQNGIVEVDGVLYYFENGKKTYKGLFLYSDGNYYYAKGSGALAVNVTVNCTKTSCDLPTGSYRFDEQGRACNGIFESNGQLRYYENGQSVQKGFFKYGEDYYYAKAKGVLVVNVTYKPADTNCDLPAGVYYRFDAEGKLYQGIYEIDGVLYYYKDGRKSAAGLVKVGEDYYYAKGSGIIAINERVYATKTSCDLPANANYYFDADGKAYQGIYETNSKLYYYKNGRGTNVGLFLHTDGKYYFAAGSGLLIVDRVGYNAYKTSCDLPAGIYDFDATGAVIGHGAWECMQHEFADGKCTICGAAKECTLEILAKDYEAEMLAQAKINANGTPGNFEVVVLTDAAMVCELMEFYITDPQIDNETLVAGLFVKFEVTLGGDTVLDTVYYNFGLQFCEEQTADMAFTWEGSDEAWYLEVVEENPTILFEYSLCK